MGRYDCVFGAKMRKNREDYEKDLISTKEQGQLKLTKDY